ncbi:DUF6436 domain-containing protein [Aliidiomarina sp. Khilg15.8]
MRLAVLILIAWVAASSAALYYFTFQDYGEFDPEQSWLSPATELQLSDLQITADEPDQITLIHVWDDSCSCNAYVKDHIDQLSGDFAEHRRSVAQVSATGFAVPATPLALIFKGDQLYYAGPYASGPFCNSEDSLIADLLAGRVNLAGSYRNGLVKACRCLT